MKSAASTFLLVLLPAMLCAVLPAQSVLIAEKPADRFARDRLVRQFAKSRVSLRLDDDGPKVLADRLNHLAVGAANFIVRPHGGDSDFASLKFRLKRVSILNVMSIVQEMSDIRFVYTAGVVMLAHKDDIKERTQLRIYDVRIATFPIRDFPAPRIGLGLGNNEDSSEAESESIGTNTPSGLTLDKLEEILRTQVFPDSWGGAASMTATNGILVVRQTERGHAAIRRLLAQLGVISMPPHSRPRRLVRKRSRPHKAVKSTKKKKRRKARK